MRIAAGLGVQAGRERAQRVDAAADPVLRLEHDDVVALALQLERRDEPRQPATDDHDPLPLARRAAPSPRPGTMRTAAGTGGVAPGDGCGDRSGRSCGRSLFIPAWYR